MLVVSTNTLLQLIISQPVKPPDKETNALMKMEMGVTK